MVIKKMHVVGSGPKAGSFAECRAEIQCRVGGIHPEQWNLQNAAEYIRDQTGVRVRAHELTSDQYLQYFGSEEFKKDAVVTTEVVNYLDLVAEDFAYFTRIHENEDNDISVDYDIVVTSRSNIRKHAKVYGFKNVHITATAGKIKLFRESVKMWEGNAKEVFQTKYIKAVIVMDKKEYERFVEENKYAFVNPHIVKGTRGFMNRVETVEITADLVENGSTYMNVKKLEKESKASIQVVATEQFDTTKPDFPVTSNTEVTDEYKKTISFLHDTRSVINNENNDDVIASKDHHYVDKMVSSYLPEASVLFNEMLSKKDVTPEQKKDIESKFLEMLTIVQRKATKIKEKVLFSDRRLDAHLDFIKNISE